MARFGLAPILRSISLDSCPQEQIFLQSTVNFMLQSLVKVWESNCISLSVKQLIKVLTYNNDNSNRTNISEYDDDYSFLIWMLTHTRLCVQCVLSVNSFIWTLTMPYLVSHVIINWNMDWILFIKIKLILIMNLTNIHWVPISPTLLRAGDLEVNKKYNFSAS